MGRTKKAKKAKLLNKPRKPSQKSQNKQGKIVKKSHNKGGRPRKKSWQTVHLGRMRKNNISDVSSKTITRRAAEIADQFDNNVALLEKALKIAKERNNIVSESKEDDIKIKHTKESALAFFVDYNFSVYQYRGLVSDCKSKDCSIYPSYRIIGLAKKECLVPKVIEEDDEITVDLQTILDKSVERLCNTVTQDWDIYSLVNLEMTVTLGFDSSANHLNPHQKSSNQADDINSAQQSLFVSSFNIIQIVSTYDENCVWLNPTPQSIRFNRPLRMCFGKEDDAAIKKEIKRLNNEIKGLKKYKFKLDNGKSVTVKYYVNTTMFDGKCVNSIVGNTATCRCPMCLKTSHQFGNLKEDFTPNENSLYFGLGLLHCEIKAFEHLLHLSYRLPLKTWDVRANLQGKIDPVVGLVDLFKNLLLTAKFLLLFK